MSKHLERFYCAVKSGLSDKCFHWQLEEEGFTFSAPIAAWIHPATGEKLGSHVIQVTVNEEFTGKLYLSIQLGTFSFHYGFQTMTVTDIEGLPLFAIDTVCDLIALPRKSLDEAIKVLAILLSDLNDYMDAHDIEFSNRMGLPVSCTGLVKTGSSVVPIQLFSAAIERELPKLQSDLIRAFVANTLEGRAYG